MALRAIYSDRDDIPEEHRDFYTESGGAWVLDVETVGTFGLVDSANLKKAAKSERTTRIEHEKRVRELEEQLEEARRAAEKAASAPKAEDVQAKAEADREAREAALAKKHSDAIKKLEDQIQALNSDVDSATRGNEIALAMAKHGAKPYLKSAIRDMTKVVRGPDGKPKTVVIDEEGNPRMSNDPHSTSDMTVDELLAELKSSDEWDGAFTYDGGSGGGATGEETSQRSSSGIPKTVQRHDLDAKVRYEKEIASGKIEVVE